VGIGHLAVAGELGHIRADEEAVPVEVAERRSRSRSAGP
jgi:hypothetical protein